MQIDPDVRAFIESQRIARLATVDEHARPHVVPICFALDSDRRKVVLYSAVDEKPKRDDRLRRLRNIDANPSVQVLFDVYHDEDWSRLRYVQLRGRARIIEAGTRSNSEHTRAIALLRQRYPQYHEMALEESPVIAIVVQRIVGWRHTSPDRQTEGLTD